MINIPFSIDTDWFKMKKAGSVLEKICEQVTSYNQYIYEMKRETVSIERFRVSYFMQSSGDEESDRKQKDRIWLNLNYYNGSSSIEFKELQEIQNAFPDFVLRETSQNDRTHEIKLIKEIDKANRKYYS